MELIIRTQSADRVAMTIRSAGGADSDGWLRSDVDIAAGAWHGCFEASFCTSDFPLFRRQLESLHSKLDCIARLDTVEEQLTLEFKLDPCGHISVAGSACDRAGVGNALKFSLELDQSYLPEIIKQPFAIETAFPHDGPIV